jgi:trimethylamine--corrinoid protein Co-methyltransferase
MGLNAPVTVLGATAFHTAEVLAGITMTQLLRPGHPTVFGGAAAAFHMQNTTSAMTAIEALRLTSAASQMGKHLGFPTQSYTGFSEAKVLDAQAGVETTLGALLAVTSGMDSVSGPGMLDYLLTFSLPKLVVDDEIAGQVRHFGRDVSLADDIPTTAVIQEMLGEGHVLVADHTMEHWPSELYLPGPTWDREPYDKWQEGGATSVGDRAAAEVERLLEAYTGPEVDPAVDREARAIIEAGLTDGSELPAL